MKLQMSEGAKVLKADVTGGRFLKDLGESEMSNRSAGLALTSYSTERILVL